MGKETKLVPPSPGAAAALRFRAQNLAMLAAFYAPGSRVHASLCAGSLLLLALSDRHSDLHPVSDRRSAPDAAGVPL
jgi:hypothetical protein